MVTAEYKERIRELYDKIAPEYDISSKLYITRIMERCEEKVIYKILRNKSFPKSLDIGSGTGRYIPLLSKISKYIVALDFSLNMLQILKKKHRHCKNLDIICADAEHPPFREKTFDFIFSTLTFDHIPNFELMLEEIFRLLKNERMFIVSSFNEKLLERYRRNHGIPENTIDFETENVPKTYIYEKGHTPEELTPIFKKIGFKNIIVISCCLWPVLLSILPKGIRSKVLRVYGPLIDKVLRLFRSFRENALLYIYLVKA